MGVQAVGGLYNYSQQNSAAKRQAKFSGEQAQANAEAVREDLVRQYSQYGRRDIEAQKAAARQVNQVIRQAAMAKGELTAGAAAGGVEGNVLETTLNDFRMQELSRLAVIDDNLASQKLDNQERKAGAAAQGARQIAAGISGPIQGPNLFGALFEIGSSSLQMYLDANPIGYGQPGRGGGNPYGPNGSSMGPPQPGY